MNVVIPRKNISNVHYSEIISTMSRFKTIIREIGFWSRGGRPDFFLGGLPSGIGGLLSITSIGGLLLHARGVASSKF